MISQICSKVLSKSKFLGIHNIKRQLHDNYQVLLIKEDQL